MSDPVKSTFRDWSQQKLELTFDLKIDSQLPELVSWMEEGKQVSPTKAEGDALETLRSRLEVHANGWNEEEIKLFFIGQLLSMVNFEGNGYSSFAGRTLSAVIGDYELSGIADGLIATGRLEPISPYFLCIYLYKPEKGRDIDPVGQVMCAMMVAKHLNDDDQPIYGAYILGRIWFFLVLGNDKKYAVSSAHDATSSDIVEFFGVLKVLKSRIESQVIN